MRDSDGAWQERCHTRYMGRHHPKPQRRHRSHERCCGTIVLCLTERPLVGIGPTPTKAAIAGYAHVQKMRRGVMLYEDFESHLAANLLTVV